MNQSIMKSVLVFRIQDLGLGADSGIQLPNMSDCVLCLSLSLYLSGIRGGIGI